MAGAELASLTAAVADGGPCGPDLDLEGDPDFLNFMAKAEGILPTAYFSMHDGRPFDRGTIDFTAEFEASKPLLERTRDLRLLATVAKLHILNRDLEGFATCIEAIAVLLDSQWDNVHPRGEGSDYAMRMAALETLDDLPTVVHPLQFVPLVNHRRHGQVTYRNYMTATGEVRPRDDEEQPLDAASVDRALMESDLPPLTELLRRFESVQSAFGRIRTIWIDRAGFEQAVNLEKASQTLGKIVSLIGGVIVKRDPSAAVADAASADAGAAPARGDTSPIASMADAADALGAAADYFSKMEPSNPARLLVRQAQQLVGRSFVDAIRILVPAFVDQANIPIGTQHVFDLPIERLSALEDPDAGGTAMEDPEPEWTATEEAAAEESPSDTASEEFASEDPAPEESSEGDGTVTDETSSEVAAEDNPGEEPEQHDNPSSATTAPSTPPMRQQPRRMAATRQQAFTLMEQVAAYYRITEPTSPIPVIVERARDLASRDFMSLLKDFLPDSALRSTAPEG
jgi:type VI secretion system protein ImpA